MKKFILGMLFGIALCAAGLWYFDNNKAMRVDVGHAGTGVKDAASNTANYVKDKVGSLDLSTANIKDELTRAGAIIRRKATDAGAAIADATADARITTAIKGKLVADSDLSALSISVSTTGGLVTMSGTASSPENIRKAIQLAWDTDGVRQVVSTIQVKE